MKEILKFSKNGCEPCQKVTNFLDARNIKYRTINPFETTSEEEDNLVLENNITTIPVTILQENGKTTVRKAGYNEKALEHLIEKYLGN